MHIWAYIGILAANVGRDEFERENGNPTTRPRWFLTAVAIATIYKIGRVGLFAISRSKSSLINYSCTILSLYIFITYLSR
jgi:hypothetical protein